jgi:hypothetical protein
MQRRHLFTALTLCGMGRGDWSFATPDEIGTFNFMAPTPGDLPAVLLADDAHLASEHDLAQLLARAKARRPSAAVILAGQGRLLTLVARDRRIEQAVRIRAPLLPGTAADTSALVTATASAEGPRFAESAILAIHEIAAGVPGDVVRLTELAGLVSPALVDGLVTADDVEAVHRRRHVEAERLKDVGQQPGVGRVVGRRK